VTPQIWRHYPVAGAEMGYLEAPIFMGAGEPMDQDQGRPACALVIIE
jgi:hypothetical protein